MVLPAALVFGCSVLFAKHDNRQRGFISIVRTVLLMVKKKSVYIREVKISMSREVLMYARAAGTHTLSGWGWALIHTRWNPQCPHDKMKRWSPATRYELLIKGTHLTPLIKHVTGIGLKNMLIIVLQLQNISSRGIWRGERMLNAFRILPQTFSLLSC